jgi:hypothetical protein
MRRSALLVTLSLLACASPRSPEGAADRFVDKYYVESDQQAALPLAEGRAKRRLEEELKLVAGSRRGVAPGSLAARVYYERRRIDDHGLIRSAEYVLHIKPQGGPQIDREAHLELKAQPDGSWRISNFNETGAR